MGAPYCTVADVAAYLGGLVFTTSQTAAAQQKVDAAIAYANRTTLQAWNLDPITGEQYQLRSRLLRLRSYPVTSVQQIQVRTAIIGDLLEPLTAGMDWELIDPARGKVLIARGDGRGSLAFVDYTPNRPVPADIVEACVIIAAESMYPVLYPDRRGITRAEADQRIQIQYGDFGTQLQVPEKAQCILLGYRPLVWG